MSVSKLDYEYNKHQPIFEYTINKLMVELCDRDRDNKPIMDINGLPRVSKNRKEFFDKQNELLDEEIELSLDKIIINVEENKHLFSKYEDKKQESEQVILLPVDVAALMDLVEFRMNGESKNGI
jgi:hypothetical protein